MNPHVATYQHFPPTHTPSSYCCTSHEELLLPCYLFNKTKNQLLCNVPYLTVHLLLLSSKYCGRSLLQLGHGLTLQYFSKHSLQSSLPHFSCCLGSSATSRHITHCRALPSSSRKSYLLVLSWKPLCLTPCDPTGTDSLHYKMPEVHVSL